MTADADLTFRELKGIGEISQGAHLITQVFGAANGEPVPADLMMAISLAGGYVGGAFLNGDLVGAAVGFGELPGPDDDLPERAMHSHVAAVSAAARGHRIGYQLKLHQREWALDRGIAVVEWTFDPLVRRNARLNLTLLGASAVAYLPNLYGEIPDALNAGQESDRVLVRWDLTSPRAIAAVRGTPREGVGRPVGKTPPDIETLLRTDPGAAREWRRNQRAVLQPLLDGGAHLVGLTSDGTYLVQENA